MGKAFTFRDHPFPPVEGRRRVLITGAAGRIGAYLAEHCRDLYDLRLMVRGDEPQIDLIEGFGDVCRCDLLDLEGLKRVCEGIDTVVHLAAEPSIHSTWEQVLPNNIVGSYNMFSAAKAEGCRRVVFASSVNAVNAFGQDAQVRSDDPVNPTNLYGVSKCFGEALCRFFANREGISAIALRIGAFQSLQEVHAPNNRIPWPVVITPRDLHQLVVRCIDDERLQFAIFQGMSNNRHNKYDISDARELIGYKPVDDVYAEQGE